MHRPIRRKDRESSPEQAAKLLTEGEYGVLSTVDGDCQPYGIPLSYVYADNCIYFHCAKEGHKLENLLANHNVSFCVVGKTEVLQDKFSTRYESVIVSGTAAEIFGEDKNRALLALINKYSPDYITEGTDYIAKSSDSTTVIRIEIKRLTGKARR